jgi:ubiquinone/menaquinone biosynthesis C-methylase UbiE
MKNKRFLNQHYEKHAKHFETDLTDPERIKISNSWFDNTTADFWRHDRSYECAEILAHYPNRKWLTVGDGRWGLDSTRIRKKGIEDVLPTDISESLLREAKKKNIIFDYAVENAESLSFNDSSFDYIFCKESLHHFPRPLVALYEMLRVAKEAVFIIEPNDKHQILNVNNYPSSFIGILKYTVKFLFNKQKNEKPYIKFNDPDWEISGNYVYSISRRDIEKVALALNLPQIAIKGLNDHYVVGCEFEPADENKSTIFKELKEKIQQMNTLCMKGECDYDLLMAGFFLKPMDSLTHKKFIDSGWQIIDLPANPYISREY